MFHIDLSRVSETISNIDATLRPPTPGLYITRKIFSWVHVSTLCLCRQISVNLFPCLQLVGLVKLSLHQFYLAFSEQSSADLCLEAEVRRREKEKIMEKEGEEGMGKGGGRRRGKEG